MSQTIALRWFVRFFAAGVIAALAGCASVELKPVEGSAWKREPHAVVPNAVGTAFAQAADCCRSLRELPYRNLSDGGVESVTIDLQSPAHVFDTGKSFFAAYRVVDLPRPAIIELSSFRSAEPGAIIQKAMPDLRQAVFEPSVLLLNDAFEVVRRVDAPDPRTDCALKWMEPAFEFSLLLAESPKDVAYIVLLSTGEALARHGRLVCGLIRDGMSPVGELQLRTRLLPQDDQPLRQALPVKWYPDARRREDVGLWQFMVAESRLLAVGTNALHVLEAVGSRYRELIAIPYDSLLWTSGYEWRGHQLGTFSLAALPTGMPPGQAGAPRYHVFDVTVGEPESLRRLTDFLAARIAPDRLAQTIAWRVLAEPPSLGVEGGSASRIGQAAMAGGIVTAFPCALCETGACPPEVLGSCAALFGVGALLGGSAGVVKEIFSSATMPADGSSAVPSLAAGEPVFSPARLTQCLGAEIERSNRSPWREAGLSAWSMLDSGTDLDGRPGDYRAEVLLRRLILVHAPDAEQAVRADRWRLRIDAQIRLSEPASGRRQARDVSWQSQPYPVAAWMQRRPELLAEIATEGCEQLARRLVAATESAWRGKATK